ncbi:MAG TPA: hypothetical protein VK454_03820 [Myxococcaceae bacterium]|nr:hypothetical protein [Myxococcaceae bacterium]
MNQRTLAQRVARSGGAAGLVTLAVALAAWAEPDGGGEDAALRQRYGGEYRFVGGAPERASVPAAVERSVDGMFFISRGIAYDRLLRNCDICSSYVLTFTPSQVTVGGPCQLPDISPADGGEVEHRTKLDETSQLSQRFVDGALVQEFRGEGGSRRVVWRLDPDGETLHVQMVISSHHLPRPVDYTLTYRRKGAPAVPPAGPSGTPDAGPGSHD